MTVLEIILILVVISLVVVLLFETKEYRKQRDLTSQLQAALNSYTAGYTVLATTVGYIEKAFDETTEVHKALGDELIRHSVILDIHNQALSLNPKLTAVPDEVAVP